MTLEELIENKKSRDLISLVCPQCNCEFEKPKNEIQVIIKKGRTACFCSPECFRTSRMAPDRICVNCNNTFRGKGTKVKFCSQSCGAKFNNNRKGTGNPVIRKCNAERQKLKAEKTDAIIKEELLSGVRRDSQRASTKAYLLRVRGNICEVCGINEWRNLPVPLILDHIDGNSENNFESNLRLVCGNCDMQLPTYKGRNKGNGRESRYKKDLERKNK